MTQAEKLIAEWQAAGLLDDATAARLKSYEAERPASGGMRWQVMLALGFGAILLIAGIALFVAAHWEQVSPAARFWLLLAVIALIHAGAVWSRPRFDRLATALHAVGTGAAGAGIFLAAQIFNIEEHWPTGILAWALCAAAGWWLLRDDFQLAWTLLLIPAWVICEFGDRSQHYAGTEVMVTRQVLMLGISYVVALVRSQRAIARGVLLGIGIVLTAAGILGLQAYDNLWRGYGTAAHMPLGWLLLGWLIILGAPAVALFATRFKPQNVFLLAAFLLAAFALPHMFSTAPLPGYDGKTFLHAEPWLLNYLFVAALAVLLAWTGITEHQPALINFGVLGFGFTVVWFYFSNILDKMGRSLSLIGLGLLFVAGGWALEKLRRRLVRVAAPAQGPEPAP